MTQDGWIVIFASNDGYRYSSGVVHRSKAAAQAAIDSKTQVGEPVDIVPIHWDDTAGAKWPWTKPAP